MATSRFNANNIAAARKLKDTRTDPTTAGDAGMRYSSAILSEYQNKAIKQIVLDKLTEVGMGILNVMPEMIRIASPVVIGDSSPLSFPADCLNVLSAACITTKLQAMERITDPVEIMKIRVGKSLTGSVVPLFYVLDKRVYTKNIAGAVNCEIVYVLLHPDIVPSLAASAAGKATFGGDPVTPTTIGTLNGTTDVFTDTSGYLVFVSGDVGKMIAMWDSAGALAYWGYILSRTSGTIVTVGGGNISGVSGTKNIICAMVYDHLGTDIILAPQWDNEIVERMVKMGVADATNLIGQNA